MAQTFISGLSPNEIEFMKLWSEVKKRPDRVLTSDLDRAAGLLGFRRSGSCSGCLRNDANSINNKYRLLLNAWKDYNKPSIPIEQEPLPPVEQKDPPIEAEKEKGVVKKRTYKKTNKK